MDRQKTLAIEMWQDIDDARHYSVIILSDSKVMCRIACSTGAASAALTLAINRHGDKVEVI